MSSNLLSLDGFVVVGLFAFILSIFASRLKLGTRANTSPPRLGGLVLFLGLAITVGNSCFGWNSNPELGSVINTIFDRPSISTWCQQTQVWLLMIAPIFFLGFIEDCTNRLSPGIRFCATLVLGVSVATIGYDRIVRVDLPFFPSLDILGLTGEWLSLGLTALAIAGYIHAMNIVDGLHGLAVAASMIMLIGLGSIALTIGAHDLAMSAFLLCAVCSGVFLVNFPRGLVFLGDSGAYLLGFFIVVIAIAIPARYEQISPWASLVICSYPVIEVLFSIWRRMRSKKRKAWQADRLHLHSLVYRRLVRNNPTASLVLIFPICTVVSIAVLLPTRTPVLQLTFFLSVSLYVLSYRMLIRPFVRK